MYPKIHTQLHPHRQDRHGQIHTHYIHTHMSTQTDAHTHTHTHTSLICLHKARDRHTQIHIDTHTVHSPDTLWSLQGVGMCMKGRGLLPTQRRLPLLQAVDYFDHFKYNMF